MTNVIHTSIIRAGLLSIIMLCGSVPALLAQSPQCAEELRQGEDLYNRGRFQESITLITRCLEKSNVPQSERQQAYRLMGLNYVSQDALKDARNAVRDLLLLVPNYQPNADEDPPQFVNMVEQVRAEMAQGEQPDPSVVVKDDQPDQPNEGPAVASPKKSGGALKWILIGGGIIAGGVAAAVLGGGGDGGGGTTDPPPATAIAPPPALPGGN